MDEQKLVIPRKELNLRFSLWSDKWKETKSQNHFAKRVKRFIFVSFSIVLSDACMFKLESEAICYI